MNEKQTSTNTERAAGEKATERTKSIKLLKMVKDREAARSADPNWTAVIVKQDNKTEIVKWMRTDEINDKIF